MKRLISGTAVAVTLMFATAPAAMAQQSATGGTSASSTVPAQGPTSATTDDSTATAAPAVSTTKTVKLTRDQTKRIQKRVHVTADGALGSRTRAAIKKYQGKKRLTRTGRPNLETIKAMKMPFAAQVEQQLRSTTGTAADNTNTTSAPVASGDLAAAIAAAQGVIGTPYANGGNDASGFDCSGLTVYAFDKAGISLPRTSFEQYKAGTAVERSAIQPGDLVFFSTAGAGASHVGIATGPTTVISATTRGVMEHRIDDDYWGAAYVGARRFTAGDAASSAAR